MKLDLDYIIEHGDEILRKYCDFADTLPAGSYIGSVHQYGKDFECHIYRADNTRISQFGIKG